MMKKTLSVTPAKAELLPGAVYLVLELFVLPYILAEINARFAAPLSPGMLNAVFFLINFCATTLIFFRFLKKTFWDFQHNWFTTVIAAIQGFLLYWACNFVFGLLVGKLNPDFANVNDAAILALAEKDFLPIAVCTVFFVPVAEELLFRGVLFAGFYNRNSAAAFLVSVTVFCAIHVIGYIQDSSWDILLLCFIQYIPAGLTLGWAYAKSGTILAPMLMHMSINAIGIFVMR